MSAPSRPKRRRLRKVLAGIAIGLGTLVVLVVAAVALVLYTPAGTHKALRSFVSWYDGRIAGHVEIGGIEGSLAGGLTLSDVRLADAGDRTLLEAHRIELRIRPLSLFGRTVSLKYLDALGLRIHQWPAPGGWGDLAPADRPPPPPDEPPGPDLPVTIDAPITVDALAFIQHAPEGERALVDQGRLVADLHAAGRDASVELHELSARVDTDRHVLAATTAELEWSSPLLEIERLSAVSDVALVHDLHARLDVQTPSWTAELRAVPLPSALGVREVPPGLVQVEGRGSFEAVRARVHARAPGLFDLEVEAGASTEGELATATAIGSGSVVPRAALDRPGVQESPRPVAFLGGLRKRGDDVRAAAALVSEELVATASADGDALTASVRAPGTRIEGRLVRGEARIESAELDAEIQSLSRLRAEVGRLVPMDLPAVRGSLSAHASCEPGDDAALACEAKVDARELALQDKRIAALEVIGHAAPGAEPLRFDAAIRAQGIHAGGTTVDSVVLDASGTPDTIDVAVDARRGRDHVRAGGIVMPGPQPTVVALERLEARVKGREVSTRRPAWISVQDGAVDVDGLALNVAGGRLSVQGRASWEGESDLVVEAHRVDLGIARDFVPAAEIDGRLDAHVELSGDARDPKLAADIAGRRLRFGDERLGDVWLRAGYDDRFARVDLAWADRGAAARIRAEVPIELDLRSKTEKVKLTSRAPLTASVDLHAVPLERVDAYVGGPSMDGRVDVTVRAHGTAASPLLAASLTATHLEVDDREIGSFEVHATWNGERIDAFASGAGDAVHRFEASASVPLRLNARRLKIERVESARHRVAVLAHDLDLAAIPGQDGQLAGRADVDVTAEGDVGELEATAHVLGRDLFVRGREIGAAELVASVDPRKLDAHLQLAGTRVRLVEAHASVPIRVGGPFGPYDVRPDAPLVAWAELRELDLALLQDVVSDGSLAGEASGRIAMDGSLRSPRIGVRLAGDRVTARGAPVGSARIEGAWAGDEVIAEVHQRRGWQSIDLQASAPVTLDLAARDVKWHRDRPHEIDLVVKGVDRPLLDPFVELPPSMEVSVAATLQARGTIDEPRARADVRASLALEGDTPTPIAMHVELEPDEQYARLLLAGTRGPDLTVEARTDADLPQLLRGRQRLDDVTLVASADTDGMDLRELGPVLPGQIHEPGGKLLLHARAVGPIHRPALSGEIAIDDGAATVVAIDQRFTAVKLRASLDGPQIMLDELKARSGKGSVSGEGWLQLGRGTTRGAAMLSASRLPVLRPGVPLMRVDGELDVDLDATGAMTKLDVKLEHGFVDVVGPKLVERPDAIPSDDGVVYVDARGRRAREKAAKKAAKKQAKGEPWLPADMEVALEIVQPLRIRGNQVDMDWDGQVAVRRAPGEKPTATGVIQSEGGRVSFLGNDFKITRGEIRLPEEGELDPFIDLVAVTQTPEAEVTLAIDGRASRPALHMSSSPALPEDQIFALLVTGETTPEGGASGNDEVAAKAAGLLASFENPALQQALRDKVGIDRVGVSFGEAVDQPVLVVGKRVTRDIYVETGYHHNAPRGENNAELRVEYEFIDDWSLDTFFGDAAEGGVGVWWTRRFGKSGPEPSTQTAERDKATRRRRKTAKR